MGSDEHFEKTENESVDDLFAFSESDESYASSPENDASLYPTTPERKLKGANLNIFPKRQGLYPSKPSPTAPSLNKPVVAKSTPRTEPTLSKRRKNQPSNYYHPNDYYLGTDWPRLIVGTLASLILLVSVGLLALYLFDRFDADSTETPISVSTDSETNVINAYQCAGDNEALKQIEDLPSALLSGKNASGTWIAFQDPDSP